MEKYLLSLKIYIFFGMFFYLPKLTFFENRQYSNARVGRIFCNARPKSNARAHLKQRKNIVA